MVNTVKTVIILIATILVFVLVSCGESQYSDSAYWEDGSLQRPTIGVMNKSIVTVDGYEFKDSNGNGELDPYEDWRLSPIERAEDLVSRMELVEKAAMLSIQAYLDGPTDDEGTVAAEDETKIIFEDVRFNVTRWDYDGDASAYAKYRNSIQELAEETELGIPVMFVTDPAHDAGSNASSTELNKKNGMSAFPMPLGFGAIGDTEIVKEAARMQAEEYRATGIGMLYGPIGDISTEPMWARVASTFGADSETTGKLTKAYIQGLQGRDTDVDPFTGIAATLKHFPGHGANEGGLDSHRFPGRYNIFPGDNFMQHLDAMKIALEANPASLMPCYSIFDTTYNGQQFENVPASYSQMIMQDILRDELGWDGFVTSDWGAIDGEDTAGLFGMAWGDVWEMTLAERLAIWVSVGTHQIGMGTAEKWQVGIDEGTITEEDLDTGVIKALEVMFKVGLFENPYVDPANANAVVASHAERVEEMMEQAMTLLKNENNILPLSSNSSDQGVGDSNIQVYFDGFDDDSIDSYTSSIDGFERAMNVSQADYAIVRVSARHGIYFAGDGAVPLTWDGNIKVYDTDTDYPSDVDSTDEGVFGASAARNNSEFAAVAEELRSVIANKGSGTKLILAVHMNRPFIIEPYLADIDVLVADFGATDEALLDIVFQMENGTHDASVQPKGKLPMSIPASQEDVYNQMEDLANDEANKTFAEGTGLSY